MGFFDIRCQLTGISSFDQDLEGFLLVEDEGRLSPLSVLVRGVSDRLGGIDGIKSTAVLDDSYVAIDALINAGRIRIDVPYDDLKSSPAYRMAHLHGRDPRNIHGFEWFFAMLAYATWNQTTSMFLDDKPIRACLMVSNMVDAAVATIEGRPASPKLEDLGVEPLLDLAFDPNTVAREIHAKQFGKLRDRRSAQRALARLVRLRVFLDERGGPRGPESEQDTDETAHLAAVAAFDGLAVLPAFRRALAKMYPAALHAAAVALDLAEAAAKAGPSRPYEATARYKAGELMAHPKFGEGVVVTDSLAGRVEIDFPSGRRKLVCG